MRRSLSRSLSPSSSLSPSLPPLVLSSYVTGQLAFRYVARGRRHFTWTLFKVGKLVNFSAVLVRPSVRPSVRPTAPAGAWPFRRNLDCFREPPPSLSHAAARPLTLPSQFPSELEYEPSSSPSPSFSPSPLSVSLLLLSSPRVIAKTERAKVCLYSRTYIWPISAVVARASLT